MKKFLRKLLSLTALVLTVTNAWAESETVTSVATLASPSRLNNNTSYFNNSNFELNTWMNGDDNATHKYFDGGDWGAQTWDVTMQQQVSLSAGKYQLTVKSRASQDVTTFVLFAGDAKTQMQTINDNGGVFGRGWNDASVEFELDKDCTITIGVQGITEKEHNWMSFSDFRLAMFYPIEATVVDDISAALNNNNDKVVYNVNGQKVTKTGRGLYIIRSAGNQGRKVFVR